MQELRVTGSELVEVEGLIGIADLKELVLDERTDLLWPSFSPRVPERVQDFEGDMFAAIRNKDLLLHHPYESTFRGRSPGCTCDASLSSRFVGI